MSNTETTRLVHVVATFNKTQGKGEILYVNPSNVRSNSTPTSGMGGAGEITLVLRDADGAELGRVVPEVRYDACSDHEADHMGLIQQDIELPAGLAAIDMVQGGKVLDTFLPEPPVPAPEIAANLGLGPPVVGREHRRDFGASGVAQRKGVTYLIQARPDNSPDWQTLSIGHATPEFQIDKNQFPGATAVEVRIIQNAGFSRSTIDERTISLE